MRNVTVIDRNEPKREVGDIMRILEEAGINLNCAEDRETTITIMVPNNREREKLLNPELRQELLTSKNILVCKPADYRAACTLITSNHNNSIRIFGMEEFKTRFEEAANTKIDYVGVIGPSSIKVEFFSAEEAQRIRQMDVVMEDEHFPANSMQPQRFIRVPQCTKCFSFLHERSDCPSTEEYCLICGQAGHNKIFCSNRDNPKCKNCYGDHVAIAFKCPFRKVREYELDNERTSISFGLLRQVYRAKRIAAGLDPDGTDRRDDFNGFVGGPNPYASDSEEEDEQRPSSAQQEQNTDEPEGAAAVQTSTDDVVPTAAETSTDDVLLQTPTPEELREIIVQSLVLISDQLNTRGYSTASERARTAASFIQELGDTDEGEDGGEEDNGDDEGQRPRAATSSSVPASSSSSSSSTWRPVRIVRAPKPEEGEGPRRQLRRIPNFKEPVSIPEKAQTVEYPVLPKRQLRRCADAEGDNPGKDRNLRLVS